MRNRSLAVLAAALLLAGCSTHVNLIQQRRSLDNYDGVPDQKAARIITALRSGWQLRRA